MARRRERARSPVFIIVISYRCHSVPKRRARCAASAYGPDSGLARSLQLASAIVYTRLDIPLLVRCCCSADSTARRKRCVRFVKLLVRHSVGYRHSSCPGARTPLSASAETQHEPRTAIPSVNCTFRDLNFGPVKIATSSIGNLITLIRQFIYFRCSFQRVAVSSPLISCGSRSRMKSDPQTPPRY